MPVQPRSLSCPSRLFFVLPCCGIDSTKGLHNGEKPKANTQDQAYSCTGVTFADG
jgi:hypothetical protein